MTREMLKEQYKIMKATTRNQYSEERNDSGGGGPSFQNLAPKEEKPNIYSTLLAMQDTLKNELNQPKLNKSGVNIIRSKAFFGDNFLTPKNGASSKKQGDNTVGGSGHFSILILKDV